MPQPSPRQIAEQQQSALHSKVVPRIKELTEQITDIDRKRASLKDKRDVVQAELDRLRKILYDPPTLEKRGATGQGLFVHTRYFFPYIEKWITEYNAEHGKGAALLLQKRSGVHAKSVRSYRNGHIAYAGILSVDRLLTAIGRSDILDSLPVVTFAELTTRHRQCEAPEAPPTQFYEE